MKHHRSLSVASVIYILCVFVWCRSKCGPLWRFPSSARCFKRPRRTDRTPAGTRSCTFPSGDDRSCVRNHTVGGAAQCGVLDGFMGYNHFVVDVESVLSIKSLLKTYNSFHTSWLLRKSWNLSVVLRSARNGDYSAATLQSVRDEVFISLFDEVLYETGGVSGASFLFSPFKLWSESVGLLCLIVTNTSCSSEWQRQREIGADPGGEALAGFCQDSLQHHLFSDQGEPRRVVTGSLRHTGQHSDRAELLPCFHPVC